jgi:sulfoxide reductase catalytic subunit YedY
MLIKNCRYPLSEITPKHISYEPAQFPGQYRPLPGCARAVTLGRAMAGTKLPNVQKSKYTVDEKINSYQDVSTYNNFYEFGTDKSEPAQYAKNFKTEPWTVSVEGDCAKPRKFSLEEILSLAPLEERVYRHRCVEAWSIVVPWVGYSLSALLAKVEPTSKAKYVAFETFWDRRQMPHAAGLQFPTSKASHG